jgi:hypothetical protein
MKFQKFIVAVAAMGVMAQDKAFALETAKAYSNSLLGGLFIGFCVLLIAVQLVPTFMLLVGAAKSLFGKNTGQKMGQGI